MKEQRFKLVCHGTILGCIVNGKEQKCTTCPDVIEHCWIDTCKEDIPHTSRMCLPCFLKWFNRIKHKMSPEAIEKVNQHIRRLR